MIRLFITIVGGIFFCGVCCGAWGVALAWIASLRLKDSEHESAQRRIKQVFLKKEWKL